MAEYSLLVDDEFLCDIENVVIDDERRYVTFTAPFQTAPQGNVGMRRNRDMRVVPIVIGAFNLNNGRAHWGADVLVR